MHDRLNTAPCGFIEFGDDGTVVEVNETLATMLDYPREEVIGSHVEKLLPPGGRIFYHTYLFPLLKVQQRVDEIYVALRTRGGTDIPVVLNGVRRMREGIFVSDCICLRMIQRNEYEEQLLAARRLAEESSASKAKFLSMMSHDLRTPLTSIDGNAQLLMAGVYGPLSSAQEEAVRSIREACRMQLTLIADILEFAKLDSGRVLIQARPTPVSDVIARAEVLTRFQAHEASLTLDTRGCGSDAMVMADPDRLQQILLNLMTNAVKFTSAGGVIALSCEKAGARALIHVRDTGIGIAEGDLQRVFSPFVQVGHGAPSASPGGAAQGVGLGLSISRDLARAMGGDLTVQSTLGEGSIFTIDLPAASSDSTGD